MQAGFCIFGGLKIKVFAAGKIMDDWNTRKVLITKGE